MNKQTKKNLEIGIADAIARAHRLHQGRGPEDVHVDIVNDVILVRQTGVLTPMEARLARTPEGQRLIRSARRELAEIACSERNAVVSAIIGCNILRSYGDIDVAAAEEISVLVLDANIDVLLLRRECGAVGGNSRDTGTRPTASETMDLVRNR